MTGRIRFIVYGVLFLLAFAVKFRGFNDPPYDKHNFRQSQTLTTIEDYYDHGIDLLMPKTHYVGNPGYHVLEFPVFQGVMAKLWSVTGPGPWSVRLVNIISGLLSAFLLFLICRRFVDCETASLAALFFLLTPLNLIYHRSMLIEPWAVMFMLSTVYLYIREEPLSLSGQLARWFLFTLSISLAALIKALYLFPFVVLYLFTFTRKPVRAQVYYWLGIGVALVILALWMIHAKEVNSYGYFTSTLSLQRHIGFKDYFTPSFWMAMTYRVVTRFAPGTGIGLLVLSLFVALKSLSLFEDEDCTCGTLFSLSLWSLHRVLWGIILTYLLAFAAMNRIHDYYQMPLMPVLALILASSLVFVLRRVEREDMKTVMAIVLSVGLAVPSCVFFMLYSAPVSRILSFRDQVAPLVSKDNRFIFLFYRQAPYGGSFELFPKVASMYSIKKWGRYFEVKTGAQVLSTLKMLPHEVRHSAGEVVLYDVPFLSKREKDEMASMGFTLFRENRYCQVFRLTGYPVVNPYEAERKKRLSGGENDFQ